MVPSSRVPTPALPFLAIVCLLPLGGCVTGLADPTAEHSQAPRPDWRNVAIVTGSFSRHYALLGTVSAFGDEFVKAPRPEDQLRHQAARLGADAVLVESASRLYDSGHHSSGRFQSGLAIKYTAAEAR